MACQILMFHDKVLLKYIRLFLGETFLTCILTEDNIITITVAYK